MAATVLINDALMSSIDADLQKMQGIHRAEPVKKGMKDAAEIVKKRTADKLPRPGYPGDKPGKPSLRSTLRTKVVHYDQSGKLVGLAGYEWSKGGQHGHLAEEGHDIVTGGTKSTPPQGRKSPKKSKRGLTGQGSVVGRVEGRHDLANASEETTQAQFNAIENGVKEALTSK